MKPHERKHVKEQIQKMEKVSGKRLGDKERNTMERALTEKLSRSQREEKTDWSKVPYLQRPLSKCDGDIRPANWKPSTKKFFF